MQITNTQNPYDYLISFECRYTKTIYASTLYLDSTHLKWSAEDKLNNAKRIEREAEAKRRSETERKKVR